jgi:hypothetical protein
MEPEEFSRLIGSILGHKPYTWAERNRINQAMGEADSIDEMPEDIQALLSKEFPDYGPPESRATSLSTVERRIIKDSDQCPLCVNNNDPRKVPVHPNCHCDVITDSVEMGVADPASRLFSPFNQELIDIVIGEDGAILPESIQLEPGSVAVFDPENVRWADLMRWLEQVQPYLEQANMYVSIVIDEDAEEAAEQVEQVIDLLATDVEAGLEALQTKKFWFAMAKAAI